jgi:hypothetical protein
VGIESVREFIMELWLKYQATVHREDKTQILNSICLTLEIHRKAATRLMRKKRPPTLRRGSGNRKAKYCKETKRWFVHLWLRMGRMNARKMVAALPEWLPSYADENISRSIKESLLKMSATTMDRILKPVRAQLKRKSNTGTRAAPHMAAIPLRNLGSKIESLGHIEVDLVAHCGGSLSGAHGWTVTMTDIYSGWTCARVVLGKEAAVVVCAMEEMVADFPFVPVAFYFDNGTEFINGTMIEAFEAKIGLYRSRPYKKNDQAHVEQKNHTFVRELFGYTRVEEVEVVEKMNDIYRLVWQDLHNHYVPSAKTIEKVRVGSKIKRKMQKPRTPFDRVLSDQSVPESVKERLREAKKRTGPWWLRTELRKKLRSLWRYFVIATKWTGEVPDVA